MSAFLGIDCSSKAVHTVFLDQDGNVLLMQKYESRKKSTDERSYEIIDQFRKGLRQLPEDVIVTIEGPLYIQSPLTSFAIAHVISGIKYILKEHNILFFEVSNKTWKKDIIGSGGASKEKIRDFALKRFKMSKELEQDFYDAAAIALWGTLRFSVVRLEGKNATKV